jgi:cytochrome c oxidase subunit I
MSIYAGLYYWFPKITGKMLDERLGQLHFWLPFIGFNITFLPQHVLGLDGMPRRVYTYAQPEFQPLNLISTVGAMMLAVSTLPLVVNILLSLWKGRQAGPNPWRALGLEWTVSSPPPTHNFPVPPVVTRDPYGYGEVIIPAPSVSGGN